jgi:hypothetical protein
MSKRKQDGRSGARSAAALLVVGASLVWAVPANADPQPGCQAYGQFVPAAAKENGIGDLVAPVATSGPGALASLAASLRQATCP